MARQTGGMLETSARLLRLLSLLQTRRDWTGAELAERLGVGLRTIRRDIDRLRDLGYPVDAAPGSTGGYRLGVGTAMPPMLLDDDEAVAVALGLRTVVTGPVTGMEEASVRALAKLEQLLPSHLRYRVTALRSATVPLAAPTHEAVDAGVLTAVAAACRDHRRLRIRYQAREGPGSTRHIEPHRLVHTRNRWYLAAWDVGQGDWRTFRVDRIQTVSDPPGQRFAPRTPPEGDIAAYVSQAISSAPYRHQARILMHGPIEEVARVCSPAAGRLEPRGERACVLHTGADSLENIAIYVAAKGFDFEVLDPPELSATLRVMQRRLGRAVSSSRQHIPRQL